MDSSKAPANQSETEITASALLAFRSNAREAQAEAPQDLPTAAAAAAASKTTAEEKSKAKRKRSAATPPKRKVAASNSASYSKVPNPLAPHPTTAAPTPIMPAPSIPYTTGGFTHDQLNALRVAAANAANYAAVATANPLAQLNMMQQAAMRQGMTNMQNHPSAVQQPPQAPAQQHLVGGSAGNPAPSQAPSGTDSHQRERSDSLIRRDQVEAALRSKPQRGRKREDLNELERLELTRTRNREHAKSTRIRKKARYQELLDIEKKHEAYQNQISLESKRRAAIVQFLHARQVMLRSLLPTDSASDSSGEQTLPVNNAAAADDSTKPEAKPSWEEFVENPASFQFEEGWPKDDSSPATAADRMRRFDAYVQSRVIDKFGATVVPLLSFNIKGGDKGIALDQMNGGLAEVEVYLTSIMLMTGMVRFSFTADSEKLCQVSYVNALDILASSERLNAQSSHPSTVSLDPVHANEAPKAESKQDESSGPGMNI